jgi:hypothetical protein
MKDFPYEDILYAEEPPLIRSRMSRSARAAQFRPFAALEGFDDLIKETARETEPFHELSEEEREELDQILHELYARRREHPLLEAVYFRPDEKKAGGRYVKIQGRLKQIRPEEGWLQIDETRIRFASAAHVEFVREEEK